MPIYAPGGTFKLVIYRCRNWKQPFDLVAVLEQLQDETGMQAVFPDYFHEMGELLTRTIPRADFADYCYSRYPERDDETRSSPASNYYSTPLTLWIRPPFAAVHHDVVPVRGDLLVTLFARPGADDNKLLFSVELHGERALLLAEQLMQWYAQIARRFIQTLAPQYVWLAEDNENFTHIGYDDLLNHTFDTIYWANYYGPDFLDETTKRLFLTAPVGQVEGIGGGVWYQLNDVFDIGEVEQATMIEERVETHFRQLNLDRVQWKFQLT